VWQKVMVAYRWVYDTANAMHVCMSLWARWPTTGFMTMHAVTCRLTAEYRISFHPQYLT